MKKILAFTGSNNSNSINQKLLDFATRNITLHDVTILNLNDYPLPLYGLDIEKQGIPEQVIALKNVIFEYDALIIASPEHNGSMPAFLKNVIDWLSRLAKPKESFFGVKGMPVLLLSTSPGVNGGATNIRTMMELIPWWGGDVKGTFSLGSFYEVFTDGKFNTETENMIKEVIIAFEDKL